MGVLSLRQGYLEEFDVIADGVFEAICQTFPTICHTRLRVVECYERQGQVAQGDFTTTANISHGMGSTLCSISVHRDVYLNLIRNVFPKEVATEINQDTRDLLLSVMRRSLYLAAKFLQDKDVRPSAAGQLLIEGNSHNLYVPSNVKTKVVVCETDHGNLYLQFSRFPKEGLDLIA